MKKIIVLCLVLSLAFLGCSSKKPIVEVPTGKPLYGFTEEGVFFVHNTLVENAQGDNPKLRSQTSEFRPRDMVKQGDYWVFDVRDTHGDFERFRFYRDFAILYYFEVDFEKYIPNQLMSFKEWFNPEHLHFKGKVGYVFYTEPTINPFLQ
jgi:hypothetical protein